MKNLVTHLVVFNSITWCLQLYGMESQITFDATAIQEISKQCEITIIKATQFMAENKLVKVMRNIFDFEALTIKKFADGKFSNNIANLIVNLQYQQEADGVPELLKGLVILQCLQTEAVKKLDDQAQAMR